REEPVPVPVGDRAVHDVFVVVAGHGEVLQRKPIVLRGLRERTARRPFEAAGQGAGHVRRAAGAAGAHVAPGPHVATGPDDAARSRASRSGATPGPDDAARASAGTARYSRGAPGD